MPPTSPSKSTTGTCWRRHASSAPATRRRRTERPNCGIGATGAAPHHQRLDLDLWHARNRRRLLLPRRRASAGEPGREGLRDPDRGALSRWAASCTGISRAACRWSRTSTRLLVGVDDIEFPSGAHIALPKMPGTDSEGYPGFEDLVNNHYARTWTPALLISGITAGTMLASRPTMASIRATPPSKKLWAPARSR